MDSKHSPREILKIIDYYRREFMKKIDKNYIKNKLKKRKGRCKRCGKCCEGCLALDKKTKLCKIYKNRDPAMCHKDFPLDKFDQKLFKVQKTCGYRFEDKERK